MKLDIDKTSDLPVRQQIVRQVVFEIATGRLAAGSTLPSVRELAIRHKVHPNTVSQAYQELVEGNWLKRQRGRRMVVRSPDEPLVPHDEDVEDLINQTIRLTRARGYSMQELRHRVRERLLVEPPDRVLVVEREPGLVRVLTSELEVLLAAPVEGCRLEDLEANPGNAIGALVTCLPGMVWHLASLVGRQRSVFCLNPPNVDDLKAMVQELTHPALLAFVSVSPHCLSIAEGLFAGITGDRHTMEKYLISGEEKRNLSGADLVFSDSVAAGSVSGRVVPYRFVTEETARSIDSQIQASTRRLVV